MPTFERSIEISASPVTVWSIAADPSLLPKVAPDVISITVDPPGMSQVGQKSTVTAKVAGRRLQTFSETTEVIPNKKFTIRGLPGGFMKSIWVTTTLEPSKKGTRLTQKTEYEASAGYLGKALSVLLVNRTVRKNLQAGLENIKELAELKELPGK
jgi:carbon monoxide dehydrogenase subunit G